MRITLELRCLGPWRASLNGTLLPPLPTRHTRALLACLALSHPARIARTVVQQRLFPDASPEHGARHLRTTLYYLRRALGDLLQTNDEQIGLSTLLAVVHDVGPFEAAAAPNASMRMLETAIATYRGPFLGGAAQGWAFDEAQRLQGLYVDSLRRLVALARAAGTPETALEAARAWIEVEPWDEHAHHALIGALVAHGDRNGAETQLARSKSVLQREWGRDLAATFDSLARAIARLPQRSTPADSAPPQAPTFDLAEFDRLPLVGRDSELAALLDAWEKAQQGTAQVRIIEGMAGVGKTRLSFELTTRVRDQADTLVVWAIANEQDRGRAFGSLRRALDQASQRMRHQIRTACAAIDDLTWSVLRCLPELYTIVPERRVFDLPALDPAGEITRQQVAVQMFLTTLAASLPVLFVLENGHHSDEATLLLLRSLHGRAGRLLVVVSQRPGQPCIPATPVLALQTLDELAIRELVSRSLGGSVDATLAERLIAVSSGSPLFLREILRTLIAGAALVWNVRRGWQLQTQDTPLPDPLVNLLTERLRPLSTAALAFADLLAVLGRPADDALLEQLFPGEPQRLAAQAELLEHHILVERRSLLRFDHDWLREQILGRLSPEERRDRHRHILDALQRINVDPAERMTHARGAEAWDDALRDAFVVAEQAISTGQLSLAQEALAIAEQALSRRDCQDQRADRWRWLTLHEGLLRLQERGAQWTAALDALQALADQSSRPAWQAEARLRRGLALREQGQHLEAERSLRAAGTYARQAGHPGLEASVRIALASVLDDGGEVVAALRESRDATALAANSGDEVLCARALATRAYIEMRAGSPYAAAKLLQPLLERPWLRQQPYFVVRLTRQLGIINMAARAYDDGLTLLRESVRLAQQHGDVHGRLLCQTSLVYELIRFGQYAEGRPLGEATVALARHLDARLQLSALLTSLAGAALYTGHVRAARELAEEGLAIASAIGAPEYLAASLAMTSRIALAEGFIDCAREAIERAERLIAGFPHPTVPIAHVAAQVRLATGDSHRARQAVHRALDATTAEGLAGPEAATALWEAAAVLRQLDGSSAAEPHQERAYTLLADQMAAFQTAVTRQALARATPTHRAILAYRSRGPRRIVWLPLNTAPLGRALHEDEYVPVIWTICSQDSGHRTDRQRRIRQLIDEAATQGAAITVESLADALAVSPRTLLRDLKDLRARGIDVQTRGRLAGTRAALDPEHS